MLVKFMKEAKLINQEKYTGEVFLRTLGVSLWLMSLFALLPFCSIAPENEGLSFLVILLMLVYMLGAPLMPRVTLCRFPLPVLTLGLGLVVYDAVLLVMLLIHLGTPHNPYFYLLYIGILCSAFIFYQIYSKRKKTENKVRVRLMDFLIAEACVILCAIAYRIVAMGLAE